MHWSGPRAARDRGRLRGRQALFWLTGALLAAALVIGGASRENLIQVSVLELASLPLLGMAALALTRQDAWKRLWPALAILAFVAAIPLLQLIPLPFETWAALPGRQTAARVLQLSGLGHGWRPFSLTPLETWRNWLALLPPAAVFLAVASLRDADRRTLTLLFPIAAAISLIVGVAQIVGGSSLYLYETTNLGSGVGLFSNRNHQAALLLASLPFAALLMDFRQRDRRKLALAFAAAGAIFLIEIIGLVVVRSRAGVLLLAPALLGSFLLVMRQGESRTAMRGAAVLGGVILVALALSLFGSGPVLERFRESGDGRMHIVPVVAEAAAANLPFGSGVGSFERVYASVEPISTMTNLFWNHAHNDYLEVWLEAGVLGAAAVLLFFAWWVVRAWAAWRGGPSLDRHLGRAASVASGVLLIHSTVDYPLRTLSLACLFAFCCALMIPAPDARRPSGAR
ncbi:MAG TPA: O-antigen ligase family protein [Caulobacteraceae bacterium]